MNEPAERDDITIRIATQTGRQPNPAVSAITASRAAAAGNASIVAAHTAQEIICVVTVTEPAAAMDLAVVAGAHGAGACAASSWRDGCCLLSCGTGRKSY